MYDILIKNANIIDGTGKPAFKGSLAIKGDKISGIGEVNGLAKKIIDANGFFVAPGFIDVLTHSDVFLNIFNSPKQESFLQQGITTIIGGNCGASLAPLLGSKSIEVIKKWADVESITMDWSKVDEFLNSVRRLRLGVNFGTLAGYSTIISAVHKNKSASLDVDSLNKINLILNDALKGGALGISVGSSFSQKENMSFAEMIKIGQVVSKHKKVMSVHLRDEGENIVASINEILQVAEETGASLELSHFKILSSKVKPENVLSIIQDSVAGGANVNFDVYLYNSLAVALFSLLPDWALDGGVEEIQKRIKDPLSRPKIIKDLQKSSIDIGNILLSHTGRNKLFLNKTINEVAVKDSILPEEALLNIIGMSDNDVAGFFYAKNEDSIGVLLKSDLALVSSDGAGSPMAYDTKHNQLIHPRNFGAFPYAVGRYVREEKLLAVEQMIQKITSLPAKKYSLAGRGFLAKNYFADICLFDLENIGSRSTFDNPFVYPDGILGVIVNGAVALWDKKIINGSLGEVLH